MKGKKVIFIAAGTVLALILIGIFVAAANLGTLIKHGVEEFGPKVTQTSIKLNSVSVSLFGGSAEMKGLLLGNPTGYKAPNALEAERIAVRLSPGSLRSDKVVIQSIVVEGAQLHVEGSASGNNFTKIQSNVEAFAGSAPPTDNKAAKKLQVDELVLKNCKLHLSLGLLGGKTIATPLPDIRLTDLGQGPEGITPAELIKRVLGSMTGGIGSAAGQAIKDAAKDIGKGAAESVDKATKGIKSLFKKKE
ncbi:MAG: AsmA family protein [Verrucomicrobia bacterium]|nr:AsmA family protein [Verrucomicrobiota bacterium]